MKKVLSCFIIGIIFISCNSFEQKKNIKNIEKFYKVYAQREDVKELLSFYSDSNPQWVDVVSRSLVEDKDNLMELYTASWSDKNYKKHEDYPEAIAVKEILSNDSIVAVSGEYNPYYYNGNLVNKMKFTAWLYLDKEGKIKKQIEWKQYSINDLQDIVNFKQNTEIH